MTSRDTTTVMTRRALLRTAGALACGAALGRWAWAMGRHAGARKPNIVLIYADDLGWRDVGYQGSNYIETPCIDALAREGMVFSSGYACAGNCAPSRACLLSGAYTPRHHVYAVGSTERGPRKLMRLTPVPNKSGLSPAVVTMADALKAAGYTTAHFGKWHLGGPDGASPHQQGFDVSFSLGDSKDLEMLDGVAGQAADPKAAMQLTIKAAEFMAQHAHVPFFVYLAHYAIHTPIESRKETLEYYRSKPPGVYHCDAHYAACTHDFDRSVGVLLAKIKELGLDDNTIVVFTSDNGALQGFSSQEPLRGNKGCYYEGGIREPFIVRWPGVIRPGTRCDVPVNQVDLYPTFLAAAGAAAPPGAVLDGTSLLPLLRGGTLARDAIFWHFPGYLDRPVLRGRDPVFRTRPVSAIRKGDWKLLLYHEEWLLDGGRNALAENNAVELYNLRDDIGERHNLANSKTAKRDELLDDLLAWMQSVNALWPARKEPG